LYLCERSFRDPQAVLHEREIGIAVFGKPADFDPGQDTLVRVQASQLRKRLEQYFATDGAAEGLTIEIPKGAYKPSFRERDSRCPPGQSGALPREAVRAAWRRLPALMGALVAILAAVCGWLWMENRGLNRRLGAAGPAPQLEVSRLWRQMFGNGQQVYVILADSTLTELQDLMKRQISLVEYQTRQFPEMLAERTSDPVLLDHAKQLGHHLCTSINDVSLARRISLLNAALGIPTDVILARDAGPRHFRMHNAILTGPRRANPWLELFEDRLNFQSRFDEQGGRSAYFENRSPLPGEQRNYAVDWNRQGYCRVAYLPNLDGTGSVLILSGTEMGSSEAGADFVTTDSWVRQLRAALGVQGDKPVPYFEVLLRTHLVFSAAPSFEMIARRTLKF
jgi:hypothetical protein